MTAQERTILVVADVGDRHLEQIRAVDGALRITQTTDRSGVVDLVKDAEIIVGWRVPREAVQAATRLRWIHSASAGVDQLLYPELLERDILLTTSSGVHAGSITEYVLAVMLAFTRRLHIAIRNQIARRWDRSAVIGEELRGKTLGILGLGNIGRELAARAAALGVRVVGTRRSGAPTPHVERVYPPEQTDEVLGQSDFVAVVLPLTDETRGLLGADRLARMKHGAFLINVGRGAIVQEDALIAALRAGRLAGAGLDVFEREPLPQDSPLYDMPQVILTPHISGEDPHYYDRVVPLFCENLRRYLAGAPLLNVVDKRRGY